MVQRKKHKKIYLIAGVVLAAALISGYFFVPYVKRHYIPVSVDMDEAAAMEKADMGERKVLTVYFTRVGNSDFEEDVDAVSSASLMKDNKTLVGNSQLLATMVTMPWAGTCMGFRQKRNILPLIAIRYLWQSMRWIRMRMWHFPVRFRKLASMTR